MIDRMNAANPGVRFRKGRIQAPRTARHACKPILSILPILL